MGRLLVTLAAALLLASAAPAATFTVDSTGDASDASAGNGTCATAGSVCTLRAAIEEANALSGADTINFNIAGAGPHTISAATALPAVTGVTTLNCASQTGTVCCSGIDCSSAVFKIKIDRGGGTNGGIDLGIGIGSTINGCEVTGVAGSNTSGYGIILGGTNQVATCNYSHGNWGGIVATGASAVIGGAGSDDANIASDNNFGLTVTGGGGIQNNLSGVSFDGLSAVPNDSYGIYVEGGVSNVIAGNLSSGNTGVGIHVKAGALGAAILNNLVGVNRTDTGNLCNAEPQIQDLDGSSIQINNTEGDCAPTPTPSPTPTPTVQAWCVNITPAFGMVCIDAGQYGSYIADESTASTELGGMGVTIQPGSYASGGACDPDTASGVCATFTPTPTLTPTPSNTPTNTPTAAAEVTVSDSTGMCRATGDKESPASALVLTNTSQTIATLDVVVDQAEDPWFFLCNIVVQNQANHAVRLTLTLSETGGLFSPQTQTVDVSGSALVTYQIPFQTWNITPGTYELSCAANVNKKNALIVQTTSYVGAWKLGSSAGGCPASDNGLGTQVCVDTTVATSVTPAITVPTPLPAGAILDTCLTETSVAVTGGYSVGFAGAPDVFGSVDGTLSSSNRLDSTLASPARLPAADNLILTSTHASGSFQNTTGRVHALCYCRDLTMPTATPTP